MRRPVNSRCSVSSGLLYLVLYQSFAGPLLHLSCPRQPPIVDRRPGVLQQPGKFRTAGCIAMLAPEDVAGIAFGPRLRARSVGIAPEHLAPRCFKVVVPIQIRWIVHADITESVRRKSYGLPVQVEARAFELPSHSSDVFREPACHFAESA